MSRRPRRCFPFLIGLALAQPAVGQVSLDSAKARLAVIDGTIAVPGLDSTVEVLRDRWGVPHIYAKTVHDLFMAQGFVAAQDRLWQMEMWRRQGEGLLSEVLGPKFVERDRFARLLAYRGDMDREWSSYAPDTREIVRAFVQGINAYIDQAASRPPIEFSVLGFGPSRWDDRVPLQRLAALAMTGNALSEVDRARVVAARGPRAVERLQTLEPRRPLDPVPGLDLRGISVQSLGATAESYGAVQYPRLEGSNNWVVSGKKTTTGKPLLANDPHRAITLPSLRYLTHLVGPGWNVIGAGEPALPGVAGGHNERIAFGFTIVGMDQQDVYLERIRPCGGTVAAAERVDSERCYFNRGRWKPIRTIIDTIPVRGEDPRVVRLEFTEHGPIVAEDSAKGRAFVIRFVGSEPGTAGYLAQISINRARDWKSFQAAAYRWKLPTENLVYADVDGNIGWIAAGLNPIRSWSGLLPVSGDGRFEWRGFLPFAELPQRLNPASGFIATANHNILPAGYRHQLNYEWATPYRANRIEEVLRSRNDWDRSGFERLQHDEFSIPASKLVPPLIQAARSAGMTQGAIGLLARWDFVMRKEGPEPLLFAAWLRELGPGVFRLRAGEGPGRQRGRDWDLPILLRLVSRPDRTFGANPPRGRDSVLLATFAAAVETVTKEFGSDQTKWHWGRAHVAPFRHPLADAFDLAAPSRGGDENTVNMTAGTGWLQTAGASYRGIFDLADWDNSVATSVPGQSGQPGSPFYDNLLPLWANGQYFQLPFSRAAVERETVKILRLEPGNGN